MRKGEAKNWSSESTICGVTAKSNIEIARKLEEICQSLTLPEEQREVVEFLINVKNAQKINELVEDISEALMDYRVCKLNYSTPPCLTLMLDIFTKRYLQ